jgi:hypothetical protein
MARPTVDILQYLQGSPASAKNNFPHAIPDMENPFVFLTFLTKGFSRPLGRNG